MRQKFGLIGISPDQYTDEVKPMVYNVAMQDGGDTAIIDIDGYIGKDLLREWITGEKSKNTVENLKDELRGFEASKIIVNINSPGGDLNEGLVIKDMLQAKRGTVVTNLQGFSASAATAIAQAGTIRRMPKNSSFMLIHRAMMGLLGFFNQNSTLAMTEDLETIDNRLIQMYVDRTSAIKGGATRQDIADLMDEGEGYGKWIDADRALELGLIDEIYDPGDSEDEDMDRLENRKRAVENSIRMDGASLKEMMKNLATKGKDEELQHNEAASANEARVENLIFKLNHEV